MITALGDAVPYGLILIADEDERILYANQTAGGLLEVNATYLVGDRATRIYGTEQRHQELHTELADSGAIIERTLQLYRHDGTPFSAQLSLCPVVDHPLVMMTFTALR